jgi:hypothetical protein
MIGENVPDQHKLNAARLAAQIDQYFSAGGQAEVLEPFRFEPRPPRNEPAPTVKRPRPNGAKFRQYNDESSDRVLLERITAMRDLGVSRWTSAKRLSISRTRQTRLIETFDLDYPKQRSGSGKKVFGQ